MSPILLRPMREQLEHDRLIRLLQARFRRRYAVGVNLGDEPEAVAVRSGDGLVYPDLVLTHLNGPRRLHGLVEVETGESVNNLEAMAEWVNFGKVRGAFYLYVPAGTTDIARRLCDTHHVVVTEIWSYHAVGEQMRFTMTYRSDRAASGARAAKRRSAKGAAAAAAKTPAKATRAAAKTRPTKVAAKTETKPKPTKGAAKAKPTKVAAKPKLKPTKVAAKTKATKTTAKGAAGTQPNKTVSGTARKGR